MKMVIGLAVAIICTLFVLAEGQSSNSSKPYKVVCYLGSWANYRPGKGKFVIEDIDPLLCTHVVYGFAKLGNDNRIAAYDPYLDLRQNYGLGAYERFNNLKQQNPELKTLLAIGGWNEGSTKYSKMAANPRKRKIFISSCVQFLEKYGFDGLDMDWEFPASRGGILEDKQNFATLLKELKQVFTDHHLLLSAAVSAGKSITDAAYDVPAISRHLDFINLMAYDFHGGWETTTGLNAPLYANSNEEGSEATLNVDYAVKYWISKGAPAKKIILGMPLYGRSFTLQSRRKHGVGAPVSGKGQAGPYTRESGLLGYNEICSMLESDHSWTELFDGEQKAPYIFKDRQWVGYDNVESISLKQRSGYARFLRNPNLHWLVNQTQKYEEIEEVVEYIKTKKLGGGMVWSLETDDFKNTCGDGPYPLLTTITRELNGLDSPTSTYSNYFTTSAEETRSTTRSSREARSDLSTESSSTEPPTSPEGTTPSEGFCTEEGYFRDPNNCRKFYYCKERENSGFYIYPYKCGPGTVYNEEINGCDFPQNVPNCNKKE